MGDFSDEEFGYPSPMHSMHSGVEPGSQEEPSYTQIAADSRPEEDASVLHEHVEETVQGMLPSWAFQKGVFIYHGVAGEEKTSKSELFSDLREVTLLSMKNHLGSAIPWLRASALVLLITFVVVFMYIMISVECSAHDRFLSYPNQIFLLAIPAFVIHNVAEIKGLKVYLTPYLGMIYLHSDPTQTPPFVVFGKPVRFTVWFCFYMVMTNLNVLDMLTDTGFSATYMKSLHCPADRGLRHMWEISWTNNVFGRIGIPDVDLPIIIGCFAFFCMLQILSPLVATWPTLCGGQASPDTEQSEHEYLSTLTGPQNHRDVFDELAEGNGAATLQSLLIFTVRADLKRVGKKGPVVKVKKAATPVDSFAKRLWLSYILENILQMNIQTTLFAIAVYISRKHLKHAGQYQTLFSISLSITLTALKLKEVAQFRQVVVEASEAAKGAEGLVIDRDHGRTAKLMRGVRSYYIACPVLVLGLIYALAKLVAAFICEDSMWNITGCVNIPDGIVKRHHD